MEHLATTRYYLPLVPILHLTRPAKAPAICFVDQPPAKVLRIPPNDRDAFYVIAFFPHKLPDTVDPRRCWHNHYTSEVEAGVETRFDWDYSTEVL
jgi:hypothetical protein